MKDKHLRAHMGAAFNYADLSYCNRKHVGCVIVKEDTPIAIGWNGTPADEDNNCEGEDGLTKPTVVHAEDNALRKLQRSHESSIGATVFVTAAPCLSCAIKLKDAKVAKVYYAEVYRGTEGLQYLEKYNIPTEQLSD